MHKATDAATGHTRELLILVLAAFILVVVSVRNYLLFHTLAELFSIVVACGIFILAWNTRRFLANGYLLFLGLAYLFVAGLDLLHTIAYKGMGVFQGYGANLSTQLWIAARYMEGLSLFIAPFLLTRRINPALVVGVYCLVFGFLLLSIFQWHVFPDCFVEATGLTPFKRLSECLICIILSASIFLLVRRRRYFDGAIFRLLVASIVLTIASELAFTFYLSVYGLSNLLGHLLKIVSFYLVYKAIIEYGLVRPYSLLFRNLKQSEQALRKEHDRLREALDNVKKLSGLLPICSACKKIRDDAGYWNQIESYIRQHSEAEFSHGICPECAKKLYPEWTD